MNEEDIQELAETYFKERDGFAFDNDGSYTDGFKEFLFQEMGWNKWRHLQ